MASILYVSTFGSDDPTRASLPFLSAVGAIEAGHEPQIALLGESTYLLKGTVAEAVMGVGVPPLKELLSKVVDHGVPIYV